MHRHVLAAISGVMVAMADSISLEHKQDNVSQIEVIWNDFFPKQIGITFNVSYERKIGGRKVTVACYLDLLVNMVAFLYFFSPAC